MNQKLEVILEYSEEKALPETIWTLTDAYDGVNLNGWFKAQMPVSPTAEEFRVGSSLKLYPMIG